VITAEIPLVHERGRNGIGGVAVGAGSAEKWVRRTQGGWTSRSSFVTKRARAALLQSARDRTLEIQHLRRYEMLDHVTAFSACLFRFAISKPRIQDCPQSTMFPG
jgi:hypothetical protein